MLRTCWYVHGNRFFGTLHEKHGLIDIQQCKEETKNIDINRNLQFLQLTVSKLTRSAYIIARLFSLQLHMKAGTNESS